VEGYKMPAFNPPPLPSPRNQEKPIFNCPALSKVTTTAITTTTNGNVNVRQKNQI